MKQSERSGSQRSPGASRRRQLLVVTRLGVRFDGGDLQSREEFERRLQIMKLAAARFVSTSEVCVGWVIETDPFWFDTLTDEISAGKVHGPPNGSVVVSRRGTQHELADLDRLAIGGSPLLVVRLDSDDVYLPEGIDRALELAEACPDGVLIDFPHGYLLQPETEELRNHSYVMQGPFFGFTVTGPDLTRIHGEHTKARSKASRVLVVGRRSWVQTVHGANIVTEFSRDSLITRLRQFRRSWSRNSARRSLGELPRYVSWFTPPGRRSSNQARNAVATSNEWAQS